MQRFWVLADGPLRHKSDKPLELHLEIPRSGSTIQITFPALTMGQGLSFHCRFFTLSLAESTLNNPLLPLPPRTKLQMENVSIYSERGVAF